MNRNKLKGAIVANGLSQEKVADKIGISMSRLNAKINGRGGADFTLRELRGLVDCLNMDKELFWLIFMSGDGERKETE